jgi:hypothetical protein
MRNTYELENFHGRRWLLPPLQPQKRNTSQACRYWERDEVQCAPGQWKSDYYPGQVTYKAM